MKYLLLLALTLPAQNWPSFRGPGARGVDDKQNLPVKWDVAKGKNIAWKTEIPGLGLRARSSGADGLRDHCDQQQSGDGI
jgi:hypothetical protein